jgi:DNA-binding SARP family transcriptional activator
MPPIEIRLLGGFQMSADGVSVADLTGRQQALLAYVLLQPNQSASRQQIAFALWPESTDSQARTNLRRLLLLLRRGLTQTDELCDITPSAVGWNPQFPVPVDLHCFEAGLSEAPPHSPPRRAALDGAVAHYTGDLLPDCYDEWILPERERLRNAYAQALAELTLLAESERDYPAAIAYARRLLRHDPLHEASYRRLMRLLALTGDRASALQNYHTCATLLHRELGVEPGPETRQLYAQLLHQDSGATAQPERSTTGSANRLVGRVAEWQAMQEEWRLAAPGHARWVLITGEAGIGKSRLAEEMLAWAERQGIPGAQARAYASTGNVSYGPLVDLLRNERLRTGWAKLADHWLVELSRLLPEIHSIRPDILPPSPLAEEWQKRRLFEALAQALLADGRPHLLVLDDLQWADAESLQFLAFLLRHPTPARLLLVGTARTVEMMDNSALQTVIEEATGLGQLIQLPLAPLSASETGQLAAQTDGTSLDTDATTRLHSDAGGNPLFVVEMVRAGDRGLGNGDWESRLTTQSPIPHPRFPIPHPRFPIPSLPPKIQAVIESRLARLSKDAREIVAQAAVLGRSFTYPVLVAAMTLDESALVDGLDELWRRQVIREVGVGGDGYDFSHDRIRDVAYGVISAARRRLLHRRAGEALLRIFIGELGPVQGQLGYHFARAGDNPAAIGHYRQAATVALERYAHAEASEYLTAAIALAGEIGDAAVYPLLVEREQVNRKSQRMDEWATDLMLLAQMVEHLDDGSQEATRRRANLALSDYYYKSWTGHSLPALDAGRLAVKLAQACRSQTIEAIALTRCGLELWRQGNFDAAQSMLAEGYTVAIASGPKTLTAENLEIQAQVYMFSGGSAALILDTLAESGRLYEEAGSLLGASKILNKLGYLPVAQGNGEYSQALAHFLRGLEFSRRIGDQMVEIAIGRNLAMLYTCQGDYSEANQRLDRTLNFSVQLFHESDRNIVENYRGFWFLQQGRLTEAKATQKQVVVRLREQKQYMWVVKAITALGWIAFYEGAWGEAERQASEGITESEAFNEERQIAHSCTLRGWARLKLGRMEEAIPDFERSAEILLRLEMENRAQEPLAGLAQAAYQRGDLSAAHAQAAAIAAHLLSHPLDRTTDTFLAIHTCHAILCAAGDPLAGAVKALAQAHLQYRADNIEPEHLDGFWAVLGHSPLRINVIKGGKKWRNNLRMHIIGECA